MRFMMQAVLSTFKTVLWLIDLVWTFSAQVTYWGAIVNLPIYASWLDS